MRKILFLLLLLPLYSEAQIITTFAGDGISGHTGDGGPATAAQIPYSGGGAFDRFGNYYFVEATGGDRIRKVSPSGIINTVAGNGGHGFGGDGGQATAAQLKGPAAVAIDAFGNIYIADQQNERIRKVDGNTGIISTIAGNGIGGFGGDGGPSTAAMIFSPLDICLDKFGNLYIADAENHRIRKINTSGVISTIVGTSNYVYNGDGGSADTSNLSYPTGVCADDAGNLYIADNAHSRVRKVNAAGIITTIAGNGTEGYSGDGGPATAAEIYPYYVTFDKFGNLYIDEPYTGLSIGNRIRVVGSLGIISTVAGGSIAGYNGDGIIATSAKLNNPVGITTDSCGNLYIGDDYNHRVRKIAFNPNCWEVNVKNVIQPIYSFIIHPNPATTSLTISAPNNITTLSVTNLLGQTVFTHEFNSPRVEINVADLPKGIYLVRVNGTEVRKFVKE